VKTKKTGADDDHAGLISLKVVANTTTENLQDSNGAATAFLPVGTINLTGGLQSSGGDIVLGGGRADDEVIATPSIIIEPPSKGTATISGRNVTMAHNEKMVVNGSVSIVGTDTVTLNDITADNSISVTAPNIVIQQRQAGTVFASNGDQLLHDVNTDFVARNAIDFNGNVTVDGAITANRVLFATVGGQVSGAPSGTSVRAALNADVFTIIRNGGNGESSTCVRTARRSPIRRRRWRVRLRRRRVSRKWRTRWRPARRPSCETWASLPEIWIARA